MTNREIIKAFKQGGTGNCVSIAIIKAGIEIFGMYNIFDYNKNSGDEGFSFMMQDGFEAGVSDDELQLAKQGSKFILLEKQEVFDYANICFAAMAKRAMIEGNDDQHNPTYEGAIKTLNNGEYYLHGPNWIGLRHNIRYIGRKYARNNPGCVGASKYHCFFVSRGVEVKYGRPDNVGFLERRFVHWFRLTKDQVF